MKKPLILSVLVLFLLVDQVRGEFIRTTRESYFGLKNGLNYSGIIGLNSTYTFGFHTVVYTGYMIDDNLATQLKLLFSMQGVRGGKSDPGKKVSLNNSYLALPVMFKYYVTEGFSLQTGPQIGLSIGKKESNLIKIGTKDHIQS
ncbi:MAG: outer membrane beta-barrel protein [Flavobacteriales bacterium AspAUS03]